MVEQNGLEEIVERKSKFGLYAKVLLIPGYSFKAEYDGNKKRGYSTMDSFFMTGELAGFDYSIWCCGLCYL